ncbi:MAG: hypothetical protein AABX37_00115, partial [Nanoarchaeota archaeon]
MKEEDYTELLRKYTEKVKEEFGEKAVSSPKVSSKEYMDFKRELYPARYSWYERACNISEHILHLKADAKKTAIMQKNIETCHLNATPSGVISFALLAALFVIVVGSLTTFALPTLLFDTEPMLFLVTTAIEELWDNS